MGEEHETDTDHMQQAAQRVWRVYLMWLLLLMRASLTVSDER